ncbi:pyridoxal kinase isoform X2 [Schistocerca americana]|uniref:pyridoxal kinase isoform X2 n=1 Tax=Schistocerca americana TaxID=7009 RepID=UPI001F5004E8|nr:pyridoxal kinase isoform X2 [Schistocerca americana]
MPLILYSYQTILVMDLVRDKYYMLTNWLMKGLASNGLDHYSHLLTGYSGSPTFLKGIADAVKQLRAKNPNLIYVCDPVMGDNGRMYVPEELLPIYRDVIVPLADIITPNQYEVELLTGQKVETIDDAWRAVDIFHNQGIKTVVLSSTELGDEEHLLGLASSVIGKERKKFSIRIPRIKGVFTGTGDLFAALFLAWMYHSDGDTKLALEKTIATLQGVLHRTHEFAGDVTGLSKPMKAAAVELRLIQSRQDIEKPEIRVRAQEH